MEFVTDLVLKFSSWMRPHLFKIALAMIATLLVIYGNSINRSVKRLVRHYNFIIRVLAFVLLCAFGYGTVVVFTAPILAKYLSYLEGIYLSPIIIGTFLVIGGIAERKNRI